MKTKISRLIRSICLSIVFVLTFFSLFQGRGTPQTATNWGHILFGSLLLIGSLVHIATNLDWIRAMFSRSAHEKPRRMRLLRNTDLFLFLTGTACAGSALIWLPTLFGVAMPAMSELHTLSGLLMSLILFIHLLQHFGWLVNTLKGYLSPQPGASRSQTGSRPVSQAE